MGEDGLETIAVFDALTPEDRERVAAVARQLEWDAGHVALREGEFAFDFYAIKHGAVEVQRDGKCLTVLGAGDFFGEIGLVGDGTGKGHTSRRRSATVIATAPTEVVAIAGSDIRRLMNEVPALRDALNRAAAERSDN